MHSANTLSHETTASFCTSYRGNNASVATYNRVAVGLHFRKACFELLGHSMGSLLLTVPMIVTTILSSRIMLTMMGRREPRLLQVAMICIRGEKARIFDITNMFIYYNFSIFITMLSIKSYQYISLVMIVLLYLYILLSTPQTRRTSSVNSTTVLTKPSIQLKCGECPVGA